VNVLVSNVSDNLTKAIDEEINSMIKIFESDQKRLKGVLITLEEKKQDLNPNEI